MTKGNVYFLLRTQSNNGLDLCIVKTQYFSLTHFILTVYFIAEFDTIRSLVFYLELHFNVVLPIPFYEHVITLFVLLSFSY